MDSSDGLTDSELPSSVPMDEEEEMEAAAVRERPFDGEPRQSRLNHAVIYKRRNPQEPYHSVGHRWGIAPSTLYRHCTRSVLKTGGQPVFSAGQESLFAKHLLMCADALWPVTTEQLKDYVKRFIEVNKIRQDRFKNGRPGKDWVTGFLRRHPDLKKRRAAAISKSKAYGTSADKLREFFARLKPVLSPDSASYCTADCVLNYDETAIGDDAGDPFVITRKSDKSPRAVLSNNKANRSVMFSVTADGKTLAPFVVTKSKFKDDEIEAFKAPECFWATSKRGWFTMPIFDQWFEAVVVPWARSKGGKPTVVLGDNLSCHLSPVTLDRAGQLGISFRLLPPNTTHFLQPLDVAYFGPLKRAWREILLEYKQKHQNKSLLKKHFASEFKKLIERAKPENVLSGFKSTGLVPFDPEAAVARMPPKHKPPADESGALLAESLRLNAQTVTAKGRQRQKAPPGSELATIPPTPPPTPEPTPEPMSEQQTQLTPPEASASSEHDTSPPTTAPTSERALRHRMRQTRARITLRRLSPIPSGSVNLRALQMTL